MYQTHFGLSEEPFGITPDPSFAFSATAHQGALNTLLVAVASGEGFIKITGEVGTGKTLLCRRFLSLLGPRYVTAYIPNPMMDARGLMMSLGAELEISMPLNAGLHGQLRVLNAHLLDLARADKRVVVCIDEAQAMPLETLEALRLASNLETEKRKLIQVVLFGQPELDANLKRTAARQLRQRITFEYRLEALGKGEVPHYLSHRLRVAGHKGESVFSGGAARLLYRASAGVPRLLNIVAHKALMAVYGEGGGCVKTRHVRDAVRDTPSARLVFPWYWAMVPAVGLAIGASMALL
ncbi:MAG: ExeA family protein [Burkholderiales bacterium]